MKSITIGRSGCDIILSDGNVSRHHATITLVNGQYVYQDTSSNGSLLNGRIYRNEKFVISPGAPVFLANKVPLPWAEVLTLLPNSPVYPANPSQSVAPTIVKCPNPPVAYEESIGVALGIISFLIPLVGLILYFVWGMDSHKAKQAGSISLVSFVLNIIVILSL